MAAFHVLNTALTPRLSWSGGAGSSSELITWPNGSAPQRADFELRLALDHFEADGPYPSLAGFEHGLVPFSGTGSGSPLALSRGDDTTPLRVRRGELTRFPGADTTRVTLSAGGCTSLAITTRASASRMAVQLLELRGRELREPLTRLGLLLVTRGALHARATDEEEPFELEQGQALWIADARDGDELALTDRDADSELLLLQIRF